MPGGSWTSTFTVPASARSFGHAHVEPGEVARRALDGWTVTWAAAAAGRREGGRGEARAAARARRMEGLLHGSGPRSVVRYSSKSDTRAATSSCQSPGGDSAAPVTT